MSSTNFGRQIKIHQNFLIKIPKLLLIFLESQNSKQKYCCTLQNVVEKRCMALGNIIL